MDGMTKPHEIYGVLIKEMREFDEGHFTGMYRRQFVVEGARYTLTYSARDLCWDVFDGITHWTFDNPEELPDIMREAVEQP